MSFFKLFFLKRVRLNDRIASAYGSWGVSSPWLHIPYGHVLTRIGQRLRSLSDQRLRHIRRTFVPHVHKRWKRGRGSCQSRFPLPGPPSVQSGGWQQEPVPSYGPNLGNKAVTPALVTNSKSSLRRGKKKDSAYNTGRFHWFVVQSHISFKVLTLIFNTSFPFSWQAERTMRSPGPWSCSPPRWVSPLAGGTAFLPKLLIRSNQNKS